MLGLVFYTKWVDSYFVPTTHMDLYEFLFFFPIKHGFLWVSMDFINFMLNKYGFIHFAKCTWISMDFYVVPNMFRFVCIPIFCQIHMILRTSCTIWISTLFSTVKNYGYIHWSDHAWISMDFTGFFYFRDLYGLLLYALTIMDL